MYIRIPMRISTRTHMCVHCTVLPLLCDERYKCSICWWPKRFIEPEEIVKSFTVMYSTRNKGAGDEKEAWHMVDFYYYGGTYVYIVYVYVCI